MGSSARKATACGLPLALSVMLSVAVYAAAEQDVNVTSDLTCSARRERTAASICYLSKVAGIGARDRHTGDTQGRTARVAERDGLSRTGHIGRLASKGKAGG